MEEMMVVKQHFIEEVKRWEGTEVPKELTMLLNSAFMKGVQAGQASAGITFPAAVGLLVSLGLPMESAPDTTWMCGVKEEAATPVITE